jgi:heterodisulfide reductase subunit D
MEKKKKNKDGTSKPTQKELKPDLVKNKPPHLDDIYACLQCGYCKSVCPVYRETGWESLTPRGKVYLLKHLIDKNSFLDKILGKKITNYLTGKGKIPLEEAMIKIYTCTLCSRCETICHVDIDFHEYWEEIRKWMVENGIKPPKNTIDMYHNIAKEEFKNPFMEPCEKRNEWYRDDYKLPEKADIVYYVGCMNSYYEYQVLLNQMKVFTKAEVNFTTLGADEMCCGAINTMTGQWDNFKQIAEYNVGEIKKRGAKQVITGCPGCYRAFKKYFKFVDCDFELLHTTELMANLIKEGKLEFTKEFKEKNLPVIYHDPCELGRISEYEGKAIFDAPRFILKSIPGIDEILEFPQNRMDSICCGGGGGLKAVDYDLTAEITARKVDEAIELGAKTIVSACPNCKAQIGIGIEMKKDELKNKGQKFKMKMMDITDIVAKAL